MKRLVQLEGCACLAPGLSVPALAVEGVGSALLHLIDDGPVVIHRGQAALRLSAREMRLQIW